MSLIYLSIPYSHPDQSIRTGRMAAFWKACAHLIEHEYHVVSPMSMEPALKHLPNNQADWNTWEKYCVDLLSASEEVWVLQLEGWDKSQGVQGEIDYAKELNKTVRYLHPEDFSVQSEPFDLASEPNFLAFVAPGGSPPPVILVENKKSPKF